MVSSRGGEAPPGECDARRPRPWPSTGQPHADATDPSGDPSTSGPARIRGRGRATSWLPRHRGGRPHSDVARARTPSPPCASVRAGWSAPGTACMTLSATRRPTVRSRARKTAPMEPRPISFSIAKPGIRGTSPGRGEEIGRRGCGRRALPGERFQSRPATRTFLDVSPRWPRRGPNPVRPRRASAGSGLKGTNSWLY